MTSSPRHSRRCPRSLPTPKASKRRSGTRSKERGVPVRPQSAELLPGSWRRWQQAFEAYEAGDEAENFQAVGVRLRECLVSFINAKSVGGTHSYRPSSWASSRSDFFVQVSSRRPAYSVMTRRS
jgi:hypothetical protein